MADRGVQSRGVKQLIDAETRAKELVKQARNEKILRMKQAKKEAVDEIERYRAQKQQEFDAEGVKNTGSSTQDSERIQADTAEKLKAMKTSVEANRSKVLEILMDSVCKVETRVHEN